MSIIWDETYSVGVKSLDNQHKRLFSLINEFFDATEKQQPLDTIAAAFDHVLEYTGVHFATEEQYMEYYKYADLDGHKELHAYLVAQAKDYARRIHEGDPVATMEAFHFLKDWLEVHIKKRDTLYSESMQGGKLA